MRRAALAWTLAALIAAVAAPAANAAYPGVNGRIAYANTDLFTLAPDGTDPTDLGVAGSEPAYSPDGKRLAFVDTDGHLMVANADGSGAVQVPADDSALGFADSPSWSPDGTQIVLSRTPPETEATDLDVVTVATGAERTLVANVPSGQPDPSWSPDGARIAYAADGDILVIPAAGGTATDITNDPTDLGSYSSPDWSPSGQQIAAGRFESGVESFTSTIEVMDADGANRATVAGPLNQDIFDRPAWSPDGRLIAYEDNTNSSGGTFIAFAALSGTAPPESGNGFQPSWQPTDDVPPTVDLRVPAAGASYDQGARVLSDYACADPPPGAQVVTQCTGTAPAGAPVPTGAPGTHVFTVTAIDRMGNRTVVSHTYTVLPPLPVTTILTGPPSQTRSRTATFTFTASNGPVTFSCAVDNSGFGPCSGAGTHVVKGLSLGVHHFFVRARNARGADPHPAERTWKVLARPLPKAALVFSTFERHVLPREFVLFRSVVARHVPAGTRIRATCRGRGCPRARHRSWFVRKARAKVRLTSWIRDRELRPITSVFVELTKPGFVGKGKLYCVRHHRRVRIVSYTVGRPRPSCG
jgi:hypothetical protein